MEASPLVKMEYKDEKTSLYPFEVGLPAHSYRLQKIGEIQKEIEQERDKRSTLSTKYHRSVKLIRIVDGVLAGATTCLGVAGIVALSTTIGAPAAIVMEGVALGVGVLCLIGGQVNIKLALKAEKHEKIKTLAESKLNTISEHISKALKDNVISDEEFSLILSELDKFKEMKEEIRSKVKVKLDEATKNEEDAMKSFRDAMKSFRDMFEKKSITKNV